MSTCAEEMLLFFEYAEDFRRGHPLTNLPFDFSSSKSSTFNTFNNNNNYDNNKNNSNNNDQFVFNSETQNKSVYSISAVLSWAESLFLAFIVPDAPYPAYDCCTDVEVKNLQTILNDCKASNIYPPHDLFVALQVSAFSLLKIKYLNEFSQYPSFNKLLIASIHATERVSSTIIIIIFIF
jgi:hypothetical protein